MRPLNTTSYAILGWLSLGPWTTYELAREMRRNLRFFWPRAQSGLYEEPKNLVEHGLARAVPTRVGRRTSTTYRITTRGRRALARWVRAPSEPLTMQSDALLRVFFGLAGTPDDMLASIRAVQVTADEIQARGRMVAAEYLDQTYRFPERAHVSGLIFDLLWGLAAEMQRWAEASAAEVETWDTIAIDNKSRQRAFDVFKKAIRAVQPPPA